MGKNDGAERNTGRARLPEPPKTALQRKYSNLADMAKYLPPPPPKKPSPVSIAYAPDPSQKYNVRYELRDISQLVTSNTDTGTVNPAYPQELQPRDRTTVASKRQIETIAQKLVPAAFLDEFKSLDRGAPIIGDDNVVESGNGRSIALRTAYELFPEKADEYKQALRDMAEARGIDPAEVDKLDKPVLVRVRLDEVDRVQFTQVANNRQGLEMNISERSKSDAGRISGEELSNLKIGDDTEKSLRSRENRDFIRSFVSKLPENERGATLDRKGDLTQDGLNRVNAALFTRVYNDPSLSEKIFLSNDNNVKNVTNGMMSSLGRMGQAEELANSGLRDKSLSIRDDVAKVASKFSELKADGVRINEYLIQQPLWERELSPVQEKILVEIDKRSRSGKQINEFFSKWADLVQSEPNPNQASFFGGGKSHSRDELIAAWLDDGSKQQGMF